VGFAAVGKKPSYSDLHSAKVVPARWGKKGRDEKSNAQNRQNSKSVFPTLLAAILTLYIYTISVLSEGACSFNQGGRSPTPGGGGGVKPFNKDCLLFCFVLCWVVRDGNCVAT
jgi:hypothetical protein